MGTISSWTIFILKENTYSLLEGFSLSYLTLSGPDFFDQPQPWGKEWGGGAHTFWSLAASENLMTSECFC